MNDASPFCHRSRPAGLLATFPLLTSAAIKDSEALVHSILLWDQLGVCGCVAQVHGLHTPDTMHVADGMW